MIDFEPVADDNSGMHINIMPLVDVIFILLIFFLLTANNSRGIVLDLPEASSSEAVSVQAWEVAITEDEKLLFNQVPVERSKLAAVLNNARKQAPDMGIVVLKAHRDSSVASFVNAMDTIRETGFYNLVIATDNKSHSDELDRPDNEN